MIYYQDIDPKFPDSDTDHYPGSNILIVTSSLGKTNVTSQPQIEASQQTACTWFHHVHPKSSECGCSILLVSTNDCLGFSW